MSKEILSELDATLKKLYDVLSSFNQETINTVPFEGSWTAAQVGEHLRKSYDGVVQLLKGKNIPTVRTTR